MRPQVLLTPTRTTSILGLIAMVAKVVQRCLSSETVIVLFCSVIVLFDRITLKRI